MWQKIIFLVFSLISDYYDDMGHISKLCQFTRMTLLVSFYKDHTRADASSLRFSDNPLSNKHFTISCRSLYIYTYICWILMLFTYILLRHMLMPHKVLITCGRNYWDIIVDRTVDNQLHHILNTYLFLFALFSSKRV